MYNITKMLTTMDNDIIDKFNQVSINKDINDIPEYVMNDLKYLATCYVNNITEFDFTSDTMIMCTMDSHNDFLKIIDTCKYRILYDNLEIFVTKRSKDTHVNQSLLQTYLDYYLDMMIAYQN